MKYVSFIFFLLVTCALFVALNYSFGGNPALGRLLSPHHGYLQNAESQEITIDETLSLNGLKENVTVQFDDLLIPHIYAKNDYDLYFTQGYITAYHRLFQMDLLSYKTSGRISEILGEGMIEFDRGQRRRGLVLGAKEMLETIESDPQMREVINGYTDGVNAYIEALSPAKYPLEYKLLDFSPEPWTPLKSCLVAREMADQLARDEADLEYTNALNLFGKQLLDSLYPELYSVKSPVVEEKDRTSFQPVDVQNPDIQFPVDFTQPSIIRQDPRNGSNNFVVGGSKSANGDVYFSNEMDLPLSLPSIWYMIHLNSPDCNVLGVSIPGAPFVIVGLNDSIAWGFSNAQRDVVDWYSITFKDEERNEYLYDGKWLKTQKEVEEIKVKGTSSYFDTIVYTHMGPVTYDRNLPLSSRKNLNLAMRWTGHDASEEYRSFFQLNRASNYQEFRDALAYFSGPPQNMAFASASGDIGIQVTGKYPLKWQGQGKFLMDGSDRQQEWQQMTPYDHLVRSFNPERGFVSSANQHPTDSTYPYYVFHYHFERYRNRRINDRLLTMFNVDEEDMMGLQNDNFNYLAYENLPMMIQSLDSSQLDPVDMDYLADLGEWDYFNEPNLEEPTVFDLWKRFVLKLTWDEFDTISVPTVKPTTFRTFDILRNVPNFSFLDQLETTDKENAKDLIQKSFQMAIDSVENWKIDNENQDFEWYRFNNTSVNHLLRIPQFSVRGIEVGGGSYSVNQVGRSHGPSIRIVSRMNKEGNDVWAVYPGSQSGNPGNPTYGNMIGFWAQKKYYKISFDNQPLVPNLVKASTTLQPAR